MNSGSIFTQEMPFSTDIIRTARMSHVLAPCREVKIAFVIAQKEIMWQFSWELSRCSVLFPPK